MVADFQVLMSSPTGVYAEALRFFRGDGMLNNTLARLASDLDRHQIEYAVIGAIALNQHGYQRLTVDIDLLISPEALERFKDELVGLGDRPFFEGAKKKFRSLIDNVPVEVITSGEFPGDGLPKPVAFPEPTEYTVVIDGIKTITLEKLVELKLASGMTATDRLKDLADVQELIKIKNLDTSFADGLNEYVRPKYLELLEAVEQGRAREEQLERS